MFSLFRLSQFWFVGVLSLFVVSSQGTLIWNGPSVTYTQPGTDPTQPANQDRLTPKVWLTRTNSSGLFNATLETSAGALSPADTEWAFGTADQHQSLTFSNWLGWLNGQSPTTLVGKDVVVHLISEDIYISMKFTLWGSKGAGGFGYVRSTPPLLPTIWNATATNGFQFNYSTTAGSVYVVDASVDLVNWLPLATNVAVSTVGQFQESSAGTTRFYRVRQTSP